MKQRPFPVFLICYLSYLSIYVARLNLSMAAPTLKALSILTTGQFGLLGSLFSVVYACGHLICGVISDRVAPWKMIAGGLVFCGLANVAFGLLPPFAAMAQSLLWGPILRTVSTVYPPEAAKRRAPYLNTACAAGSLLSILLSTRLIARCGVQWAFLIPGAIPLILTLFLVPLVRRVRPVQGDTTPGSYLHLLRDPALRSMLPPALIHGVMKDNISLWMAVYVMDRFSVDLDRSAGYVLFIPLLGFLGSLLTPALRRLVRGREQRLLALAFVAAASLCLALIFLPVSALAAVAFLALLYMSLTVLNVCFLAFFPMRYAGQGHVASVSGILDFATYLGAGLGAMVYGAVIERLGYETMFGSWAVLCVLALLLLKQTKGNEVR